MTDAHDIQAWLNGDQLRSKQMKRLYWLIGLVVALIFLYILIGYQAVRQQHRLSDAKKEMVEAQFLYMSIHAELTNATRPSEIQKALKDKESTLEENTEPTIKILN